jgi:hypothetical protein
VEYRRPWGSAHGHLRSGALESRAAFCQRNRGCKRSTPRYHHLAHRQRKLRVHLRVAPGPSRARPVTSWRHTISRDFYDAGYLPLCLRASRQFGDDGHSDRSALDSRSSCSAVTPFHTPAKASPRVPPMQNPGARLASRQTSMLRCIDVRPASRHFSACEPPRRW